MDPMSLPDPFFSLKSLLYIEPPWKAGNGQFLPRKKKKKHIVGKKCVWKCVRVCAIRSLWIKRALILLCYCFIFSNKASPCSCFCSWPVSIQSTAATYAIQEVSKFPELVWHAMMKTFSHWKSQMLLSLFLILFFSPLASSTAALPKCEAETGSRKHPRHKWHKELSVPFRNRGS